MEESTDNVRKDLPQCLVIVMQPLTLALTLAIPVRR